MAENKNRDTNKQDDVQDPGDEIIEGEIVDEGPSDTAQASPTQADSEMIEQLDKAQGQAKEYYEGWQRERAEFINYKRRVERDQQAMALSVKGEIIKKYLPVLDDLERALKARPTEGTTASWANGIELIYRKLQNILDAEGVKRIPSEAKDFDPNLHEAISYEESPNHESGQVIEIVQQGYTLGDRVLRPALVRVAR